MQIAIVDNDRALVRSLILVLSNRGHAVTGFVDAQDAATALGRTVHPDVLILDCVMPGLDGAGLLERVHARLPAHCRVVLISGHGDRLRDHRLRCDRVSARLAKPLDLHALAQRIDGEAALQGEVGDEHA